MCHFQIRAIITQGPEQQQLAWRQGCQTGHKPAGARLCMQALTVNIKPGQREVQQALATPVIASALMVQYSAVWENLSEAAAEVLHCPRCSHTVIDVHGVCRYCRENAFQVWPLQGQSASRMTVLLLSGRRHLARPAHAL